MSESNILLRENLLSISMHGIAKILRAKTNFARLFWIFCVLLSMCGCSIFFIKSISQYLAFDVTTKYRYNYESVLEFPTVRICNLNPFTSNYSHVYLEKLLQNSELREILTRSVTKNMSIFDQLESSMEVFTYSSMIRLKENNFTDEEKKNLGTPLKDMILNCKFNLRKCNENDFKWMFDSQLGNCYEFNSKYDEGVSDPKIITRSGTNYGLSMDLFIGDPTSDIQTYSKKFGVSLLIYNNSHKPDLYREIIIPIGFKVDINVKLSMRNHFPYPYSDCKITDLSDFKPADPDYFNYLKKNGFAYNKKTCSDICVQKHFIKKCKCMQYWLPRIIDFEECINFNHTLCVRESIEELSSKKFKEECDKICLDECNFIKYELEKEQATFPSIMYANLLMSIPELTSKYSKKELTYLDFRESMVSFNVYYNDLAYGTFTETPAYTVSDLFSNIGGTLGLYLGISILSLIEVAETLLIFPFRMIKDVKMVHNNQKMLKY